MRTGSNVTNCCFQANATKPARIKFSTVHARCNPRLLEDAILAQRCNPCLKKPCATGHSSTSAAGIRSLPFVLSACTSNKLFFKEPTFTPLNSGKLTGQCKMWKWIKIRNFRGDKLNFLWIVERLTPHVWVRCLIAVFTQVDGRTYLLRLWFSAPFR